MVNRIARFCSEIGFLTESNCQCSIEGVKERRILSGNNADEKGQSVSDLEATLIGIIMFLNAAGQEAYAVPISEKLTGIRNGREVAPGALYTSLQRLVNKGLLAPTHLPSSPERGGRGKRLYNVTGTGVGAYRAWVNQVQQVTLLNPDWQVI
jgi:hypothetical protein